MQAKRLAIPLTLESPENPRGGGKKTYCCNSSDLVDLPYRTSSQIGNEGFLERLVALSHSARAVEDSETHDCEIEHSWMSYVRYTASKAFKFEYD